MKIIKENKPKKWSKQVTCTGKGWRQGGKIPCGSVLEIDENDVVFREWFKYPDSEGVDFGFLCPLCGCFTPLDCELDHYIMSKAKKFK